MLLYTQQCNGLLFLCVSMLCCCCLYIWFTRIHSGTNTGYYTDRTTHNACTNTPSHPSIPKHRTNSSKLRILNTFTIGERFVQIPHQRQNRCEHVYFDTALTRRSSSCTAANLSPVTEKIVVADYITHTSIYTHTHTHKHTNTQTNTTHKKRPLQSARALTDPLRAVRENSTHTHTD